MNTSYALDSISGVSRFKMELPAKKESLKVMANNYVMSNSQAATVSCPSGTKLIRPMCSGESRSSEGVLVSDTVNSRSVFVNTSVSSKDQVSMASCNAVMVKPLEFVRLSITAECLEVEGVASVN